MLIGSQWKALAQLSGQAQLLTRLINRHTPCLLSVCTNNISFTYTSAKKVISKFNTKSAVKNFDRSDTKQYTHTHPFNGPLSGSTRVSWYQKGKTNLDFPGARDSEWQWHQLGCMQVCTSLQTDNPTTQCFTGRMPFLPPNQQPQRTEGTVNDYIGLKLMSISASWTVSVRRAMCSSIADYVVIQMFLDSQRCTFRQRTRRQIPRVTMYVAWFVITTHSALI